MIGLEQLHDRPGDMEQEDDPRLLPALQPEGQHQPLNDQRPDDQNIIARDRRPALRPDHRPQQMSPDQQHQHGPAEQTGPPLLQPEPQELIGIPPPPPPIRPRLRARHQTTAPGFERETGGWGHEWSTPLDRKLTSASIHHHVFFVLRPASVFDFLPKLAYAAGAGGVFKSEILHEHHPTFITVPFKPVGRIDHIRIERGVAARSALDDLFLVVTKAAFFVGHNEGGFITGWTNPNIDDAFRLD